MTCSRFFTAKFLVKAKGQNNVKCPTIMEWHTTVKKIKTVLHVLMCSDLRDISLNEKGKVQKMCVIKIQWIFACLCIEHLWKEAPKWLLGLLLGRGTGGLRHGMGGSFTFQCIS